MAWVFGILFVLSLIYAALLTLAFSGVSAALQELREKYDWYAQQHSDQLPSGTSMLEMIRHDLESESFKARIFRLMWFKK